MNTEINKTKVKQWGIRIGIVLLILLLLKACIGDIKGTVINGLGGYTAKDVKTTIDTISIRRDTIRIKYDSIRTVVKKIVEPKVVYKYVQVEEGNSKSSTKGNPVNKHFDSVFVYNQVISDSVLSGNIKTIVSIQDYKIIEQSLVYTPKIPIIVKEYITIEKKTETTLYDKPKGKIGVGILGSSKADVGLLGVYQTKKNLQYQVGYNKNLNSVVPGIQTSYYNNGVITVSIIKLF